MSNAQSAQANIGLGISLRIISALSFSLMSGFLKLASMEGLSAPEMVFYRATLGLPLLFAWIMMGPGISSLKTNKPWLHVRRSLLGTASLVCTFAALRILPLADAITIQFMVPVFATILSFFLLKETVGIHRWLAVVCGFLGVAIVVRPGGDHVLPLVGVGLGLLAALGSAGVTIAVRQMREEHFAGIVFWFFTASILVTGLYMPFVDGLPDAKTFALLGVGAAAGVLAQLTMTSSLKHAPVSVIMPFDYLQMIGAILFGWFVFDQIPVPATIAGAGLIAAAGMYTVWRERLRKKKNGALPK